MVVGQESLDTLEGWVRERFEAVPVRTEGERLTYSQRVLEGDQTGVSERIPRGTMLTTSRTSSSWNRSWTSEEWK